MEAVRDTERVSGKFRKLEGILILLETKFLAPASYCGRGGRRTTSAKVSEAKLQC
jgi:hypothetical protein